MHAKNQQKATETFYVFLPSIRSFNLRCLRAVKLNSMKPNRRASFEGQAFVQQNFSTIFQSVHLTSTLYVLKLLKSKSKFETKMNNGMGIEWNAQVGIAEIKTN